MGEEERRRKIILDSGFAAQHANGCMLATLLLCRSGVTTDALADEYRQLCRQQATLALKIQRVVDGTAEPSDGDTDGR